MTPDAKVCCDECHWHGLFKEALVAENPFWEHESISGCPECKESMTIREACDEPDCWKPSSCGTPGDASDGYRRTCGEHLPK